MCENCQEYKTETQKKTYRSAQRNATFAQSNRLLAYTSAPVDLQQEIYIENIKIIRLLKHKNICFEQKLNNVKRKMVIADGTPVKNILI